MEVEELRRRSRGWKVALGSEERSRGRGGERREGLGRESGSSGLRGCFLFLIRILLLNGWKGGRKEEDVDGEGDESVDEGKGGREGGKE